MMGRDSAFIALFIALTLGLISCAPPPEPRLAIKTLVVENKETQGIVVKLRWSLDKEKFTGKDRYRFPECGFTLYRKEEDSAQPSSAVFKPLGTFSLPQSKSELIARLQQIKDEAIKYRLLSPEGLKEEGNHLWQAIEVSQTGKQHPFPADPMDLLTLAAINPDMAQVLGLLYVDTAVARGKKYTYKLVGAWDQTPGGSISCKSGPADEVVTDPPVETTPEGPLNTPLWVDIKKDTPLKQLRYITFDKPEQQVTVFWDKPTGTKQKPPSFVPEGPVVRLRWQKNNPDFVGYYIDRWEVENDAEGAAPIRVTVLPNGTPYLFLSGVPATEEKPEQFLDSYQLQNEETYQYQIIGVDIFGRQSAYSKAKTITLTPIDFPPIPPQRTCLESYDPQTGLLSDSCPKKTQNTTDPAAPKVTWVTPADLRQPKKSDQLSVRLKWQWTEKEQARFKANKFNIYQIINPDSKTPNVCQTQKTPPASYQIGKVNITSATSYQLEPQPLTLMAGNTVSYYYFCITTVSHNIDDDNDGKRDEDPKGDDNADGCPGRCGIDDDGDGQIDESVAMDDDEDNDQLLKDGIDNDRDGRIDEPGEGIDEDPYESESVPSLPLLAYVVDKIPPQLPQAPCEISWAEITGTQLTNGVIEADSQQAPNWEGKLSVRLDWSKFSSKLASDIKGYNLYRGIDQPTGEYIRLNRHLIDNTVYVDYIEATAKNKFYYRLQAVDRAGNESGKSEATCAIVLPDKIPPKPPVIINVSGGNEAIKIIWESSSSSDVAEYHLYRGETRSQVEVQAQDIKNRINVSLITPPGPKNKISYVDGPVLKARKDYYYIVEAVDKKGNQSYSLPAAGRAYDINPPAPPSSLSATLKLLPPKVASQENAWVKLTRVTPPKVKYGDTFPVNIEIQVKNNHLEKISIAEDLRAPFNLESGDLYGEWFDISPGKLLRLNYELRVSQGTLPGQHTVALSTLEAIPLGQPSTAIKMTSTMDVVSTPVSEVSVLLTWQLDEAQVRTAVWRCENSGCTHEGGNWKMIAPLLLADDSDYEDINIAQGKTYYYKLQAYDKLGNKGAFSKVVEVEAK